ncbi:MAG: hypothetical protein KDB79_13290 [Acidobacteria bacterium]|nr:hypothetical protein [Acidobacteriota bacterium]
MALKKVVVLSSTRQDVEKLFKKPKFKEMQKFRLDSFLDVNSKSSPYGKGNGAYLISYELKDANLDVIYSNGKCSENNWIGYDVKKDTVIDIELIFDEDIKLTRFDLKKEEFKKAGKPSSDSLLADTYVNLKAGISFEGNEKTVGSIELSPTPFQTEKFSCGRTLPEDTALKAIFFEKRHIFDKIVHMFNQDKEVRSISFSSTDPITEATNYSHQSEKPVTFSALRWDEYKRLFLDINLFNGLSRQNFGEIRLIAYRKSYLVANATKGYLFTTKKVVPIIDSIDSKLLSLESKESLLQKALSQDQSYYEKISDHWYIYYEYR